MKALLPELNKLAKDLKQRCRSATKIGMQNGSTNRSEKDHINGFYKFQLTKKYQKQLMKIQCIPLVSPEIESYAEKLEKRFCFSLGQMVQFDTIKLCRTL